MAQTSKPKNAPKTKTIADKPRRQEQTAQTPTKNKKRLYVVSAVIAAVIVVLGGWLVWQLVRANNELHKYKDPKIAAEQQSAQLTTEVAKVAILPQGEDPVIASVSDINQLKGKPFFKDAQNGDKVLIYKQAKKAILYRPSTRQIVEEAIYDATSQTPTRK